MYFLIKKIISALILPVPIVLALLVFGLILIFTVPKHAGGKILLTLATVIFILFSTPFLPCIMLGHLEKQFKPLKMWPPGVSTIVVLGAGNGGYPHYPANSQLSSASLARLIEGIRLHKLASTSTLILSGGRVFGSPPDSAVMSNVAAMLDIAPKKIVMESGSQDTVQEAINLKRTLGQAPFILVTSASHMPRAMAIFRHHGMQPIAAPTQMLVGTKRYSIKHYLPNSIYLLYSDIALHEYVGLWWNKITNSA